MKKVITRFAPSPTGELHTGNYRTALFSWLFAEKSKGEFILRIEDTDRERSKQEYEDNIHESLAWLGLTYTERYKQSENVESHKKHLQTLIDKDIAYISKEERGERTEVIRFRNPNKRVVFTDMIRGDIEFDTTDLGDFVIAKSIDEPLFHLAVVVDDFEEGVTHIVRGEDHISNTPRHLLIQEAIGAPHPIYAHLPMVLNENREKLGKRNGAKSLLAYREEGFLPEALINYMALLGWNPGTEQEIFTVPELIEAFDMAKINKGSAVFDEVKLRWVNKEHIKRKSAKDNKEALLKVFAISKYADKITPLMKDKLVALFMERIETYGDMQTLIDSGEVDFLFETPTVKADDVVWKKMLEKASPEFNPYLKTVEYLEYVLKMFQEIPEENFVSDIIKESIWDYATKEGRGDVLWPLRFSLTGKQQSPDPFTVAELLGKKEVLMRIEKAVSILKSYDE